MTTRIAPGVGANLLGQHSAERNQDATAYVGNLDPQVLFYSFFSFYFLYYYLRISLQLFQLLFFGCSQGFIFVEVVSDGCRCRRSYFGSCLFKQALLVYLELTCLFHILLLKKLGLQKLVTLIVQHGFTIVLGFIAWEPCFVCKFGIPGHIFTNSLCAQLWPVVLLLFWPSCGSRWTCKAYICPMFCDFFFFFFFCGLVAGNILNLFQFLIMKRRLLCLKFWIFIIIKN